MRLIHVPLSPYARKARILALEKGLALELQVLSPQADLAELCASNPLGKVPALVLDDGTVLYDSPVICEYLDSLTPDPLLIPAAGPARWATLRRQALADGVMDLALNLVAEGRRAEAQRSQASLDRWTAALLRGLAALDAECAGWGEGLELGRVAAACAVGYIGVRLPQVAWRAANPALAAWAEQISQRPSFAETAPSV